PLAFFGRSWPRCLASVYSFFFSSRRRHTRFTRDWSSDVCSSDLTLPRGVRADRRTGGAALRGARRAVGAQGPQLVLQRLRRQGRSEERRVGKEGIHVGPADTCNKQEDRIRDQHACLPTAHESKRT